jgi:hypothetical protein
MDQRLNLRGKPMSHKTARASKSFSAFKTLKKSLITTAMTAGSVLAFAAPSMADGWTNLENLSGRFSTDVSVPNETNIIQYSDIVRARGDLDIPENHSVIINQNSASDMFIAYDIESDPTYIFGRLNANGRVLVIDQNGVFFGRNSVVDVGSIVATSGAIAADDLDDGKFDIQLTDQSGAIELQGTMTVSEGGLAGFVAPSLSNSGVINAKLGTVVMASGKKATVDLYGDNLVEIAVDGALGDALIENSGTINAQGGTVTMTAEAAKDAVDNVINMSGVVDVSSVSVQGGKIILSGGEKGAVSVSGDLNANGKTGGGDIIVTGENVVATDSAVISADATDSGNGGNVLVYGEQYAIFSGRVNARGGQGGGNGGDVEISGGESVGYNGLVDLSAPMGEAGTLLIDPKNLTIHNGSTSGIPEDVLSGGISDVFINDLALANTLRLSNVNLWATKTINTGSNIDLSTWNTGISTGITGKDLTLAAPTINILHDVIMGKGRLRVADLAGGLGSTLGIINVPAGGIKVDVVNLDGTIFRREVLAGPLTIAGDSRISSQANTVNVLSNDALIQQGVYFANDAGGGVVNVGAGTYEEQIVITKNLSLKGDGVGSSIITSPDNLKHTGTSPHGGRNYGIVYVKDASNVNIDGFTIDGSTNNQTVPFTTDDRFIGVIYQNSGGVFSNNHITNIKSVDTAPRSGFGFLAFDNITGISNLTIQDNLIDGFQEYGIALANNQLKATVVGNTITGNKAGIAATQSGIYITSNADVTVGSLSDSADANTISGTDVGIESFKAKDNDILGNTISNVHKGILLNESTGYNIAQNTITGNSTIGIEVNLSSGTDITGDVISNFGTGIFVTDSDNVTIDGVQIDDILTSNAIHILRGMNNTVKNSDIGTLGGVENITGAGIYVDSSNGFTAQGNTIQNTKSTGNNIGSGIHLVNSNNALIGGPILADGNTISLTGWDGVRINGGNGITVQNNDISDVARTGVFARNTNTLLVENNDIDGGSRFGVNVESSNDVDVLSNSIDNMGLNGIHGVNVFRFLADLNGISNSGGNGIRVNDSQEVTLSNNTIENSGLNGMRLFNVNGFLEIYDNLVAGSGLNGILVENNDYEVSIYDNEIEESGIDGIHVSNGSGVYISDNSITGSGDDGIEVITADVVDIGGNIISNVGLGPVDIYGGDAIHVQDVMGGIFIVPSLFESFDSSEEGYEYAVKIHDNIINMDFISGDDDEDGFYVPSERASSQDDGIQVLFSGDTLIESNLVANSGGEEGGADFGADGINVVTGYFGDGDYYYEGDYKVAFFPILSGFSPVKVDVLDNLVVNSIDDGIEVVGANDVLIDNNAVTNAGDNGITVEGFGISWLGEMEGDGKFEEKSISEASSFFFGYWPYYTVDISNNTVDTTDTGIRTDGFDEAYISSNDVTNTNGIGIYVHGYKNGFTSLYDNVLDGFDIGMQFESGVIDLQGASNALSNGRVGLLFKPFEYDDETPIISLSLPSFVYEEIFPYPYSLGTGFSDLSLTEDDSIGTSTPFPTTPPTDYAGTIGGQVFNNIGESYVELDNFAFFQGGLPLWLNGLNSSYDGFVPASTGGILTAAQFAELESKFLHFRDGRDVGIFFFGLAPESTLDIDESLLFQDFPFFNGDITGLNIRILGLPSTGFGAGGFGGGPTTPEGLNAIGPFAGGTSPEDLNQLETAAGGNTGTELNEIDTQAGGGENTSCWGDALTSAGNGQVVDVVYSGAVDDDLDTAATCSTGL